MISNRYSLQVSILLSIALIPTIIHSYLNAMDDNTKSVQQIATTLSDFVSKPTDRNKQWAKDIFASEDWVERIYRKQNGTSVRLFVAKSFDHKHLYHHPELALSYAQSMANTGANTLINEPEVKVITLKNRDKNSIAAYTLLYENKFVSEPIKHQLFNSLKLLFSPRKPMILFYVAQDHVNTDTEYPFKKTEAADVLSLSIQNYLKAQ